MRRKDMSENELTPETKTMLEDIDRLLVFGEELIEKCKKMQIELDEK